MSVNKNARMQAGVLFLIMLLSGCATPQTQQLRHTPPKDLPAHVELTDVPFYPQNTHQCGPAALAMVLNAGGAQVTPDSLIKQVYLPGREGSLQVEMLASGRRNGLLAYPLTSSRQDLSLQNLLTEVAAGTPVVVLQNLALRWYPVWHYAVVIGYDLPRQEIILRSGLEQRLIIPFATFEYTWQRAAYWAMLALPAGVMPHTATEEAYIKAALALEKNITPKKNVVVYQAALKKWPNNLTAYIGLGNAFYTLGDKEQAEKILRQATLTHPDSAIAFNNLAQTLADQKRYIEAFSAATQAVRLAETKGGSEEQSITQATLHEIQEKMH